MKESDRLFSIKGFSNILSFSYMNIFSYFIPLNSVYLTIYTYQFVGITLHLIDSISFPRSTRNFLIRHILLSYRSSPFLPLNSSLWFSALRTPIRCPHTKAVFFSFFINLALVSVLAVHSSLPFTVRLVQKRQNWRKPYLLN